MRGTMELEEAAQAAWTAIEAESGLDAVFATVGCRLQDATRLARSKYLLRPFVPDENSENPVHWSGSLLALAHMQSERAWLNGCLVGLLMAGPLPEIMDPTALQAAERALSTEILAEEQRTKELYCLDDRLRKQNLDPESLRASCLSPV